jgi:hypothetical protein
MGVLMAAEDNTMHESFPSVIFPEGVFWTGRLHRPECAVKPPLSSPPRGKRCRLQASNHKREIVIPSLVIPAGAICSGLALQPSPQTR